MYPSPPSLPSNHLLLFPSNLKYTLKYSENGISLSFTWLISFLLLPTLEMISFPHCYWYDRINRPIRFFVFPCGNTWKPIYSMKPLQQTQVTLEQLPAKSRHDLVLLGKLVTYGIGAIHVRTSAAFLRARVLTHIWFICSEVSVSFDCSLLKLLQFSSYK